MPGMELVVGDYRKTITDVVQLGSKTIPDQVAFELESPLPQTLGKDVTFFVVRAGADPYTTFFTDEGSPANGKGEILEDGFTDSSLDLVGGRLEYTGREQHSLKILEVMDSSTLRVEGNIKLEPRSVSYRITTDQVGYTNKLTKAGPKAKLNGAKVGDQLTVWTDRQGAKITQERVGDNLTFSPKLTSDRDSLYFTTVTGGSKSHGRYEILKHLNDQLTLDPDLDTLALHVAEVMHKHAEQLSQTFSFSTKITSLAHGLGDGGINTTTNRLSLSLLETENPSAWSSGDLSDALDSIRVGDRITLTYRAIADEASDSPTEEYVTKTTYVTDALENYSTRSYRVFPEILVTSSTNESEIYTTPDSEDSSRGPWPYRITGVLVDRNPVSFALAEVARLKAVAQSLRDLVTNYTVAESSSIVKAIALLEENGMDRAVNLLIDGKIKEFFGMSESDASFAAAAKAAIQEAGRILIEEG